MARHPVPTDSLASLVLAERCAGAVAHALLNGQPDQLEAATRELQAAASALSDALQRSPASTAGHGRAFGQRLHAVAQILAVQREACLRRLGVVERSLHSIMPDTRASTYSAAVSPYGRGGPQGRAFRAC